MSGNHPREFKKRSHLFVGVHNEALTVAAMCVSDKYRLPVAIHSCDTAPTPTGFAEIVSDGFPIALHATHYASFGLDTATMEMI